MYPVRSETAEPATRVVIDEKTAWLLLTKGIGEEEAKRRARTEGDTDLASPFFGLVAVMA